VPQCTQGGRPKLSQPAISIHISCEFGSFADSRLALKLQPGHSSLIYRQTRISRRADMDALVISTLLINTLGIAAVVLVAAVAACLPRRDRTHA